MSKPSIPKGTRDFGPAEMARRNYIFDTIRSVFRKYGFLPIETPAMEKLETLTGKYGEEGDRLIFKILARGEKLSKAIESGGKLAEEALRYDLTVPFARFVVQHQNDITFPFKRYQIQPVWRADRPQKGRYREFFQCDVDVIGSDSLLNEVELVQLIDEVFDALGIEVTLKLNNRKILLGIAEAVGAGDHFMDMTMAIDKLDKIGREKVEAEMVERGISSDAVGNLGPLLDGKSDLDALQDLIGGTEIGAMGIEEMRFVLNQAQGSKINVVFDPTLARGLNYYTGTIFECVTEGFGGSILGGGRYDDLTGIFGLPNVSGVGVSFGADRIYDVMLDKGLYPKEAAVSTRVMFVNFGTDTIEFCMRAVKELRAAGIASEVYPDEVKMAKQMKYANDKQIPYTVMVGSRELEAGVMTVKDMNSGDQRELDMAGLLATLR